MVTRIFKKVTLSSPLDSISILFLEQLKANYFWLMEKCDSNSKGTMTSFQKKNLESMVKIESKIFKSKAHWISYSKASEKLKQKYWKIRVWIFVTSKRTVQKTNDWRRTWKRNLVKTSNSSKFARIWNSLFKHQKGKSSNPIRFIRCKNN